MPTAPPRGYHWTPLLTQTHQSPLPSWPCGVLGGTGWGWGAVARSSGQAGVSRAESQGLPACVYFFPAFVFIRQKSKFDPERSACPVPNLSSPSKGEPHPPQPLQDPALGHAGAKQHREGPTSGWQSPHPTPRAMRTQVPSFLPPWVSSDRHAPFRAAAGQQASCRPFGDWHREWLQGKVAKKQGCQFSQPHTPIFRVVAAALQPWQEMGARQAERRAKKLPRLGAQNFL